MIVRDKKPLLSSERSDELLVLRDQFAIIALTQIIASCPNETAERKALEAYKIADCMMRQRERTANGL
jgi:hypothetical protein